MREIRTYGSEGGETQSGVFPTLTKMENEYYSAFCDFLFCLTSSARPITTKTSSVI